MKPAFLGHHDLLSTVNAGGPGYPQRNAFPSFPGSDCQNPACTSSSSAEIGIGIAGLINCRLRIFTRLHDRWHEAAMVAGSLMAQARSWHLGDQLGLVPAHSHVTGLRFSEKISMTFYRTLCSSKMNSYQIKMICF